jgi:hypothetical protein
MRQFLTSRGPSAPSTSPETPAPPHSTRLAAAPNAADDASGRHARRRLAGLGAVVVGLIAVGAACTPGATVPGWVSGSASGGESGTGSGPAPAPAAAPAPAPAAAATAAQVPALPPGTPPIEHWLAVAQCETNGNWTSPGPTYIGGLGMWEGNWAAFGGLQFAPSADLATPAQQMIVAANLWLSGGTWGCRIGDGWDHV